MLTRYSTSSYSVTGVWVVTIQCDQISLLKPKFPFLQLHNRTK